MLSPELLRRVIAQTNPVKNAALKVARDTNGLLFVPNMGNDWQDSAQATSAVVDSGVGALKPMVGAVLATQSTSANKPILRKEPILGPELVADPSFLDASKWVLTQPTSGVVSISGGDLTILSSDTTWAAAAATMTSQVVIGKTYQVTVAVKSYTGGQGVRCDVGGVSGATRQSAGFFSEKMTATSTACLNVARGGSTAGSGGVVSDVSLREILGYREVYYLAYDGINDYLSTTSASFTLSDGLVMVWAGKVNSAAAQVRPMSAWSDSSLSEFAISTTSTGFEVRLRVVGYGEFNACAAAATLGANVLVAIKLTGSAVYLRVNGGSWVTATHARTLTGAALSLGLGARSSGALPCNNDGYAAFCANMGANATDSQIAKIERYFAQLVGVTL